MAINQKLAPCEPITEEEGSPNTSSYASAASDDDHESSGCGEVLEAGDEEESHRMSERLRRTKVKPTPASLRVSPTFGKNSLKAGSRATTNAQHALLMKRLQHHLASLRSLLPPSARSCQISSVIADALKYRKALRREIQQLQEALPFAQQVNVRRVDGGGFQVGIACQKKSGLLVALMEAMESFGLLFANVSVSCENDTITIDSLSTQEIGERIGALKGMLIATIHRFNKK